MATVQFSIGHKNFELSCQPGEEKHLRRAAGMLDTEAQAILEQAGRMPEARMLLLAALMLADRMATLEDRAANAERELLRLKTNPVRVEVPAIPGHLLDSLSELAARAESLAQRLDEAEGA